MNRLRPFSRLMTGTLFVWFTASFSIRPGFPGVFTNCSDVDFIR